MCDCLNNATAWTQIHWMPDRRKLIWSLANRNPNQNLNRHVHQIFKTFSTSKTGNIFLFLKTPKREEPSWKLRTSHGPKHCMYNAQWRTTFIEIHTNNLGSKTNCNDPHETHQNLPTSQTITTADSKLFLEPCWTRLKEMYISDTVSQNFHVKTVSTHTTGTKRSWPENCTVPCKHVPGCVWHWKNSRKAWHPKSMVEREPQSDTSDDKTQQVIKYKNIRTAKTSYHVQHRWNFEHRCM